MLLSVRTRTWRRTLLLEGLRLRLRGMGVRVVRVLVRVYDMLVLVDVLFRVRVRVKSRSIHADEGLNAGAIMTWRIMVKMIANSVPREERPISMSGIDIKMGI